MNSLHPALYCFIFPFPHIYLCTYVWVCIYTRTFKRASEDEMVEWHHQCNEHTPGDGEGQGGLACFMQSMGSQRVRHHWATEQHHHTYTYIEKRHAHVHMYINICVYKNLHTFSTYFLVFFFFTSL